MKDPLERKYHLPRWPLVMAAFWAVCWMLLGLIVALMPIGAWKLIGVIPALWGGLNLRYKIAPKWGYAIILNEKGLQMEGKAYSWKELITPDHPAAARTLFAG